MVLFVNTDSFGLFGCNKHFGENFILPKDLRVDLNNPLTIISWKK